MTSRTAVIIALHDLHRNSRVLKQAKTLREAGFHVTAVGIVRRSTDKLEQPTAFGRILRVRTTERLHAEQVEGAEVTVRSVARRRSAVAGVRMFLGRMRENAMLAKTAAAVGPDVLIASDLSAWAAGVWAKRKTRAPLICDARDLVTDSGRPEPPPYMWLLRNVEAWASRRADAVTAVTPLMADVLAKRYPAARVRGFHYNGPMRCLGAVEPQVQTPLRLLFQGNLVPNRSVDVMIKAAAELGGAAVLTIQGFGQLTGELRELVEDLGVQEFVRFVEPCMPDEVADHASRHDIGLVSNWDDTLNMRVTVGTKLFDYISGGLAVVASDLPMYRALVEEAECGVLFDPRNPDALVNVLRSLVDNPAEVLRMKRNAVIACPRYSWDVQGARFLEVVESVMAGETRGE